MLLTCKKTGKQVPGALAKSGTPSTGVRYEGSRNQSIMSENEWAERRCYQSCVIPIHILSSNSSGARWRSTLTVFCSAPAAHAGHHEHMQAVQNGGQHPSLPHMGHAAALLPGHCAFWGGTLLFLTTELTPSSITQPHSKWERFLLLFPAVLLTRSSESKRCQRCRRKWGDGR